MIETEKLAAAVRGACTRQAFDSVEKICRTLHQRVVSLRRHYTLKNGSENRRPVDEWLCDNYYVLEKESKQSLKDIRQLARQGGAPALSLLYAVVEAVLTSCMPEINDDGMSRMLCEMQRHTPISEKQFEFMPAAIKTALVGMAYNACINTGSEREIAYAITGISRLTTVDFEGIVSECSGVEQTLLEDPAGVYGAMSSESRQYYRHLIAQIARKSGKSESGVAREKLDEARAATDADRRHIGFYIVHDRLITAPRLRRGALVLSLSALLPLAAAITAGMWTHSFGIVFLCYLPFWEILRTPLWHLAQMGIDADFIPRMNLKKVEERPKTVVLVSTLLPKAAEATMLEKRLEQLYFSNSDPDMYYCILADFKEWDFPADEKDESQIEASRKVVEGLNARYKNRFMLFLRGRTFNRTQGKYAGWERKRGAITEFIRFLKAEATSVHTFVGDSAVLPSIRYIIALDSDTNMLYEAAQTLVSAAIHPLNRPVANGDGVVTRGYGILIPKMTTDLSSAKRTAFSRVLSGCGGVTAYDTRDKDFYQDLFGESIFAGKGLIDIDAFYTLLNDRFPENHVLSHDILECAHLRAGFVSDVEMTDTAPASMASWISRLHRWIRGDWQNLPFIASRYRSGGQTFENPINTLSKWKLFDNLRRSLTPVASLLCVLAALFAPPRQALILGLTGVLAVTLSSLWSACMSLVSGGFFTLSRKFFARTLPHTFELIGQAFMFLIMLPIQAASSADAIARSLWRTFVSHKNMLEWTTAAQGDMQKLNVTATLRRYALPEAFGMLYLLAASHSALSLLGIVFALCMPVAYYTARPTEEDNHGISGTDRDTLISYNAAMWRYYEDFANAENHFLPPDNIQQSPVYRIANRTSPTNIGMMLLSILAARDFDFIDTEGLYMRLSRTIATVERLKRWHGNLINWYDTLTLDTLKPEFVSTVDSGNFICCLVALKEGLREFVAEKPDFAPLIRRVEALIEEADLTKFYDKRKKLFSIGWDSERETLVDSHYDFLMSEARLTSYFAVARKTVGKKHWGALNRTMSRSGSYAGAVSWTGTMFEYYMPHLLLPVYEGSLLGEALTYCLYCQKRRCSKAGVPWGVSESAFYAFDNNLNYQYKAHGIQKLGVKRYLDRELIISPYSTFITIPQNPNSSMRNLRSLRALGVYGRYGFFEAVDFTSERVGKGALAVTRSYMAHHIGMSMVASCNALFDNKMQERFMKDNYMNSAREFLQEKIAKNTVVYDELKHSEGKNERHERPKIREETALIYPQAPRCSLLTNGEITDIMTDSGAGYLKFGEADLTRRSGDLLRRAQGVFALVRIGGELIPATKAPFFDPDVEYSVEQDAHSVAYFGEKGNYKAGLRCMIHPTISCEQRQIAIKNASPSKKLAQALIYFEPILCNYADYNAHPAYSKLFVTARFDESSKTLIFTRRKRDATQDLFLTVGFLQDIEFTFETRREALMSAPNGLSDLRFFYQKNFSNNGGGVPDACCAIRFDMAVAANSQSQATLLIAASRTEAEGVAAVISMRKSGMLEPKNASISPALGDSLEGRLGGGILGQLLFTHTGCSENAEDKLKNTLGQSALWQTGISGDLPVALMELDDGFDDLAAGGYLRLHASMRQIKVEFDLVFVCGNPQARERLYALVEKNSVMSILGARGGIFALDKEQLSPALLTLLRATARHTAARGVPGPPLHYDPIRMRRVSAVPLPDGLTVYGGVFAGGRFFVDRSTPLPFSHPLATPVFGTLVSDSAMGYTWALNSRENKLTPWYNDICTDNAGELCLLREDDACYDLARGSRASFSRNDAVYEGKTGKVESKITVTVAGRGFCKFVDVELQNRYHAALELELAYYIEPVLHVNRDAARHIVARALGPAIVMHNPYNTAVQSFAALRGECRAGAAAVVLTTDRAAFLSGDWNSCVEPQNDPCAAVILKLRLAAGASAHARFLLTFGATERSALFVPDEAALPEPPNYLQIETPDTHLNAFLNGFAAHQMLAARIFGRTAFYQCGGAYGFRDQLQDVSAYLLLDPQLARRHIIRCCSVQFEEGDVLHWWHNLPKSGAGLKGVRTRFSDDLAWLPSVAAEYVEKTGDASVLGVPVRYLHAEVLAPGEQEKYISPDRSDLCEDVFHHCCRALERAYNVDEHGLPLIGCGDWCDGFSAIGVGGRGTSVWLAMFLARTLDKFAVCCDSRDERKLAEKYRVWSASLREAVDAHAWDGEWYLRAFYDDGGKVGSRENRECRIDLIPQAFAILADMPDQSRVAAALKSAETHLVDEKLRLVRLFDPPFQHTAQKPGYVKAYPGGLRENGGQYTHSAVWFAIALLKAGKLDEGFRILEMLNPVDRAKYPELMRQYKLEPYYMPADIYTNAHAPGRGGWSAYTGAVSWYYRAIIEYLLGLKLRGDYIELWPRIPSHWPQARIQAEISGTKLDILILRGTQRVLCCDGKVCGQIPLDRKSHEIRVTVE